MNREEILNMPAGFEMDALVAEKVMGLSLQHLLPVYEEGSTDDGLDGWSGFVCPRCRRPSDMLDEPCAKYYSTDIRAAWKVVEKLEDFREDFAYAVFLDGSYSNEIGKKWMIVVGHGMPGMEDYVEAETFAGSASGVPLAICRAALLAVLDE